MAKSSKEDELSTKERHDIDSALFRIQHIHTMLVSGRPIEDFSADMLQSFSEAIATLDRFVRKNTDK